MIYGLGARNTLNSVHWNLPEYGPLADKVIDEFAGQAVVDRSIAAWRTILPDQSPRQRPRITKLRISRLRGILDFRARIERAFDPGCVRSRVR
jgi:hypothetical protein